MEQLDINIVYKAFPEVFKSDIENLFIKFPFINTLGNSGKFEVILEKEKLDIPYRIYIAETQFENIDKLSKTQQCILYCLLTRNSNGLLREKYLKKILTFNELIIVPYVMQLVGEYVYEIFEYIYEHLDSQKIELFKTFVKENPEYFAKIKQKVISYWNCYFRQDCPEMTDFVSYKILLKITDDKHI